MIKIARLLKYVFKKYSQSLKKKKNLSKQNGWNENLSKDRWKNEISFNSGPGEDGFWRNWAHPQLDYD